MRELNRPELQTHEFAGRANVNEGHARTHNSNMRDEYELMDIKVPEYKYQTLKLNIQSRWYKTLGNNRRKKIKRVRGFIVAHFN